MDILLGTKTKRIFSEFISKHMDFTNVDTYVEPFGGMFMGRFIDNDDIRKIYNDIESYNYPLPSNTSQHHLDYTEIIQMYDNDNALFYFDPPYYKKEFYYRKNNGEDFHQKLKENVKNMKSKWIISYEDCKYIRTLWRDYNIIKYDGNFKPLRNEIIITNLTICIKESKSLC